MVSFRTMAAAGLASLGMMDAAAAQSNVEAKILGGVCFPFAGSYQNSETGNSMHPSLQLRPAGTGTYLDSVETGFTSIRTTMRGTLPWYTVSSAQPAQARFKTLTDIQLALYNDTGTAGAPHRISCQDERGITVIDSAYHDIRINTDQSNSLVFDGYGIALEPYAHYVDGQRQSGVFLGAAGVTRWAWANVTQNGRLLWKPRLLLATVEHPEYQTLQAGEIAGYLMANGR